MQGLVVRARALLGIAALLVAALLIPKSTLVAQTSGVTISTDRAQYQVAATVRVCYTVAGAGPVTIMDAQPDGSSHVFFATDDDGTGYCLDGTISPPIGTECLTISASTGGQTGSDRACFQVVAQAPTSSANAQDCGQVSALGPAPTATNSGSQAAEDCFYQAYQQCTPATLQVSISGVDAGIRHTFSLQGSPGSCTITDAAQHFVVPRPPQPAVTSICTGLSHTANGGLQFSSCGGDDVSVPPGT